MCQLVLPGMRRQGHGRIVNISSIGGKVVFPGGGAYHGTKHAVEAFSDALRFEVKGFGVDVAIIEPGLIKTEFASAATSALSEGAAGDGPYGAFNQAVGAATVGAYEGPAAMLGGGPEKVAKAIEKAIVKRRPKPRYAVTPSAHIVLGQHALFTDRMWDAFVGTQFKRPRG
jgi:short-subunit dehydrogenase